MRSAHLYLMFILLTLAGLVGCGTEGGTGGGVIGFDPIANTPSVVSFVMSPKTTTLNAAQSFQYSLTATLSNGATTDAASLATFTSSDSNLVTVTGTGRATGVLPGTATITATIGSVSNTATVTVNPFVNRLFVSNFVGNSTTVYDPAVGGDQVPLRTFAGNLTTLDGPSQMTISGQELFIANGSADSTVVFGLHGGGNVAPTRILKGDNTLINKPRGIAVANGELFVSNSATNSIVVFPANAVGNVTPIRTIIGGLTLLDNPRDIWVKDGEILVANGNTGQVLGFPVAADLNVAPTLRNLTSAAPTLLANPFGLSVSATELTVADINGAVHTFAANANGVTVALRTITGATSLLNAPGSVTFLGAEMFVSNSGLAGANINAILVFPASQNNANPPTRQIVGPSTLLNQPVSVLIAPST